MVAGELFKGAFRSEKASFHLENIETRVLPSLTIFPFDVAVARIYGEIEAGLRRGGRPLADADLQIAATAVHHGLELVTGNVRRFERVPGLAICRVLAQARLASAPGASGGMSASEALRRQREKD